MTAAIAAWWLDIRASSLIRVNRWTARSNDYGFTTGWLAGCSATAALCRTTRTSGRTANPCVSQIGHAHGGEHSTTELDPSHRTTSPSLGNLKTDESSLTHERPRWEATEPQAALSLPSSGCIPPATRVAVRATRLKNQSRSSLLPLYEFFLDKTDLYAGVRGRLLPPSLPAMR